MCVNCDSYDNELPPVVDLFEAIQQAMNDFRMPKSFEQLLAEKNAELDEMRESVIKSYPIANNVRLHLLEHIPQVVVNDIINWVRRLNEVAPAAGNVDIYAPYTPKDVIDAGMADQLDGATTRVDANGRVTEKVMDEDTPHRIVLLTNSLLRDRVSVTAANAADEPNFSMPVGDHVSNMYYTIVHEWAHVYDNRKRDGFAMQMMYQKLRAIGADNPFSAFNTSLSNYGKTDEPEAFAEAFTEWFISEGKTTNFSARWYAKEFNWSHFNNFNTDNKHKIHH